MDKKKFLNLKNHYQQGLLKNGMKYIISPNPLHNTCSITIYVRVGSRNEKPEEYGLAHFLEHMLFKGSKKYKTYQDINIKIDSLHASTNASTSKNYTNYHLKLPSKNLIPGLELLQDMVFHSTLNNKELQKEKKVVIEEINKTLDDSLDYASDLLDLNLFKGHPLSHFILGNKTIINGLTRKQLDTFYKRYYVVNNSCIGISGNVPKNIVSLLEKVFVMEKTKKVSLNFTQFKYNKTEPQYIVKSRKQEQIAVSLGLPLFGINDERRHILDIISNLLYGNMTSRLWIALREKNPIVYGLEVGIQLYEEGGYFSIEMGLSKNNLPQALQIIELELRKLKLEKVSKKELDNIKDNLIEDLKEEEEDNLDIAEYYADQFLLEKEIVTYSQLEKIYQKITPNQIRNLCQEFFDFSKLTIVEVGDVPLTTLKKLVKSSFY